MSNLWVGIDPGLTGAVAVIEGDEIEIRDTPVLSNGKRNVIDAAKCAATLREIKHYCTAELCVSGYPQMDPLNQATMRALHGRRIMVTIEKSQPMPPMGRKDGTVVGHGSIASFSLGNSYGIWVGILAALEIPYHTVAPRTWKAALMRDSPKEKDASRIVADQLFPGQRENWWPLKKHHGRTDSLLLAEWGRRNSGVLE